MKIKVCGMKYQDNILEVKGLDIDFMGFIFYPRSPRFAGTSNNLHFIKDLKGSFQKVGVFVKEKVGKVLDTARELELDFVQLHGGEDADYVRRVNEAGFSVIKVFSIDEDFDWRTVKSFTPYSQYFLFDTAAKSYGGSGRKFNWELLNGYREDVPFLLSGGIGLEDVEEINKIKHKNLVGIDVNSRFETGPGRKDVGKVEKLIKEIRK